MGLDMLNPFVRYARAHPMYAHSAAELSVCYDCRLFYIESASGFLLADGVKYDICNEQAVFLPPCTRYHFTFSPCQDFSILVLDFDLVADHADIRESLTTATETTFDAALVPDYPIPEELSRPIVRLSPQLLQPLRQCVDNFLVRDPLYRETASALVKLTLLELVKNSSAAADSRLCREVQAYIHEHYADQSLTNHDIAENFSYHPYYLSRLMREHTGKSLHQYLLWYRVNIAKNYLLTTAYSIEEVSWQSGFGSAAYFIKTFREHTGMTPGKYRRLRLHTEL
ncbi:MAG: helix-turn-helix transcriptional regulator [Clostridia bacterium]|nr:helix-turn-helix domain-containing protein [Oscillospiraceae bacterium]MBR6748067.1 helix-turn-helix transcriptional regulator [Clostridia bacterium]